MFPCSALRCWLWTCLAGKKPRHGSPAQSLPELSLPSETGGLGRVSVWPWWCSSASCHANRVSNHRIMLYTNVSVSVLFIHRPARFGSHCFRSITVLLCTLVKILREQIQPKLLSDEGRSAKNLCHGCANICSFFSRVLTSALLKYQALEISMFLPTQKFFLER